MVATPFGGYVTQGEPTHPVILRACEEIAPTSILVFLNGGRAARVGVKDQTPAPGARASSDNSRFHDLALRSSPVTRRHLAIVYLILEQPRKIVSKRAYVELTVLPMAVGRPERLVIRRSVLTDALGDDLLSGQQHSRA